MSDLVAKLVSADGMPCCQVCQCDNGKKLHCACHRKQLADLVNAARAAEVEKGEANGAS